MTTYLCPDRHTSSTSDYCDVCGMPIPASAAAASAPDAAAPVAAPAAAGSLDLDAPGPPPASSGSSGVLGAAAAPTPTEQTCPHCGASNLPDALYCEDCGYDFTTGQLPRPLSPPEGVPVPAAYAAAPIPTAALDAGSSLDGPVDSGPSEAPPAGPPPDTPAHSSPGSPADSGAVLAPPVTPTSAPGHVEWVAEVWVDPDWYAAQDVTDPCPSAGMPWVIPILERTVLIGRLSVSRNIRPQIDISTDSGVSRRHAQLNSDGQRWWVEDLRSANGTYVGAAGAPLPTAPIPPGQRVELAEDDRVYLGAWSRLVVRRATPEESTLGS